MSTAQSKPRVLTNLNLNWEYIEASVEEKDKFDFYPYNAEYYLPSQVVHDFYNMYDANPNLDRKD